jgi:hypothetical protein
VRAPRGSADRAAVDKLPIGEGLQWVRGRFAAIVTIGALCRSRLQPRLGLKVWLGSARSLGDCND